MPPQHFTEHDVISCLRMWANIHPELSLGLQDDCAYLPPSDKGTLLSTDALVEGTHFRRDWSSPRDLARKLLNVNLSDLASKGGRPLGFLFSWGLSPSWSWEEIEAFCRELGAYSQEVSCPLLGGNTSRAKQTFLNVSIFGSMTSNTTKWRGGAQAGDLLCVTGTLGDARAGLEVLESDLAYLYPELREAQLQGRARLKEGECLAALETVHAMMDVSDGFIMDLERLAEASKLGFEVDAAKLPVSESLKKYAGIDASTYAFAGGEDYELLISMSEDALAEMQKKCLDQGLAPLTVVGQMTSSRERRILNPPRPLPRFEHF